jgi:hypothetical protein
MCPACLTTVALILGGATSTGTLSALALRKRRTKPDAKRFNPTTPTIGDANEPSKRRITS